MRGDKPVAKLVPIEPPAPRRRMIGGFEGLVSADDSVFDPLTDEQMVEYGFATMRNGELVEPAKDFDFAVSKRAG